MKLSKRLALCSNYTKGFNNLADIGTDHALLPIICVKNGYVQKAQAIDNKKGPFVMAYSNVKRYEQSNNISVKLSDGLTDIDDDTDVVVIAGMGGELISNIVQNGNRKNVKRFILQPNNNPSFIRRMVASIHYKIVDELVFEDQKKMYDIIVLEPGEEEYSESEILFGPVNIATKSVYFKRRLEKELNYLKLILKSIENDEDIKKTKSKIQSIKEVLA